MLCNSAAANAAAPSVAPAWHAQERKRDAAGQPKPQAQEHNHQNPYHPPQPQYPQHNPQQPQRPVPAGAAPYPANGPSNSHGGAAGAPSRWVKPSAPAGGSAWAPAGPAPAATAAAGVAGSGMGGANGAGRGGARAQPPEEEDQVLCMWNVAKAAIFRRTAAVVC